jgi:hypothetical protein
VNGAVRAELIVGQVGKRLRSFQLEIFDRIQCQACKAGLLAVGAVTTTRDWRIGQRDLDRITDQTAVAGALERFLGDGAHDVYLFVYFRGRALVAVQKELLSQPETLFMRFLSARHTRIKFPAAECRLTIKWKWVLHLARSRAPLEPRVHASPGTSHD